MASLFCWLTMFKNQYSQVVFGASQFHTNFPRISYSTCPTGTARQSLPGLRLLKLKSGDICQRIRPSLDIDTPNYGCCWCPVTTLSAVPALDVEVRHVADFASHLPFMEDYIKTLLLWTFSHDGRALISQSKAELLQVIHNPGSRFVLPQFGVSSFAQPFHPYRLEHTTRYREDCSGPVFKPQTISPSSNKARWSRSTGTPAVSTSVLKILILPRISNRALLSTARYRSSAHRKNQPGGP